jgi:hypothetical protein
MKAPLHSMPRAAGETAPTARLVRLRPIASKPLRPPTPQKPTSPQCAPEGSSGGPRASPAPGAPAGTRPSAMGGVAAAAAATAAAMEGCCIRSATSEAAQSGKNHGHVGIEHGYMVTHTYMAHGKKPCDLGCRLQMHAGGIHQQAKACSPACLMHPSIACSRPPLQLSRKLPCHPGAGTRSPTRCAARRPHSLLPTPLTHTPTYIHTSDPHPYVYPLPPPSRSAHPLQWAAAGRPPPPLDPHSCPNPLLLPRALPSVMGGSRSSSAPCAAAAALSACTSKFHEDTPLRYSCWLARMSLLSCSCVRLACTRGGRKGGRVGLWWIFKRLPRWPLW